MNPDKPMTRLCTCIGSCKGADGLAPGWMCCAHDLTEQRQTGMAVANRESATRLQRRHSGAPERSRIGSDPARAHSKADTAGGAEERRQELRWKMAGLLRAVESCQAALHNAGTEPSGVENPTLSKGK
jgi:hypothetical protein